MRISPNYSDVLQMKEIVGICQSYCDGVEKSGKSCRFQKNLVRMSKKKSGYFPKDYDTNEENESNHGYLLKDLDESVA